MATKQELLAEAYKRGLMPPEQRAAYEEAQKRGLLEPSDNPNVSFEAGAPPGERPTRGQVDYAAAHPPVSMTPAGSRFNPTYDSPTLSAAGNPEVPYYVNQAGELIGQTPDESGLDTALALAGRLALGRVLPGPVVNAMLPSERLTAMQSGGLSGLMGGLKNEAMAAGAGAGGMLRGDGYKPAYDETLARLDQSDAYLRAAYPMSYYGAGGAGMLAGAVLTPEIKAGGAGVEALARMLPGQAAVNAPRVAKAGQLALDTGIGTGSAWGSSDPGERGTGALVGGGMSAAASVLTRGMLKGAPRNSLPGSTMPEALAAGRPQDVSRAAGYVERQLGGTSLEDLSAAEGSVMMGAEAAGPRAKTALGALARREGDTAKSLEGAVSARVIDRPQRIMDAFAEATGVSPEAAAGDMEALVAVGQKEAAPLFEASRANPNPVMSPRLAAIIETPAGKVALRQAVADVANDVDGPGAQALGFEVTGMTPDGLPDVVTLKAPTAETWDRIYKALQRTVKRDDFGRVIPDNLSPANHNINLVRKALRKELEEQSPMWGQAMASSADYMGARGAFESTQKALFSAKTTAAKFAKMFEGLSAGERSAGKAGIANAIFNLAQTNRLKPGALKIPIIREKLAAALGDDGAEAITRMVGDEDAMRAFEMRYAPGVGSVTSEINLAAKEMDSNPWLDAAVNMGVATAIAGPAGAKASLIRDAANAVGSFAKGGGMMPVGARNIAGQALMSSPKDMAAFIANAPRGNPRLGQTLHMASRGAPRLSGQLAGQRR